MRTSPITVATAAAVALALSATPAVAYDVTLEVKESGDYCVALAEDGILKKAYFEILEANVLPESFLETQKYPIEVDQGLASTQFDGVIAAWAKKEAVQPGNWKAQKERAAAYAKEQRDMMTLAKPGSDEEGQSWEADALMRELARDLHVQADTKMTECVNTKPASGGTGTPGGNQPGGNQPGGGQQSDSSDQNGSSKDGLSEGAKAGIGVAAALVALLGLVAVGLPMIKPALPPPIAALLP